MSGATPRPRRVSAVLVSAREGVRPSSGGSAFHRSTMARMAASDAAASTIRFAPISSTIQYGRANHRTIKPVMIAAL